MCMCNMRALDPDNYYWWFTKIMYNNYYKVDKINYAYFLSFDQKNFAYFFSIILEAQKHLFFPNYAGIIWQGLVKSLVCLFLSHS